MYCSPLQFIKCNLGSLKLLVTNISELILLLKKFTVGTFDLGDVGPTVGPLPVSGNIISATAVSLGSANEINVVIPDQGTTDYSVQLTVEDINGTPVSADLTNSIEPILIYNKTSTGFTVYVKEMSGVAQALRMNISVIKAA